MIQRQSIVCIVETISKLNENNTARNAASDSKATEMQLNHQTTDTISVSGGERKTPSPTSILKQPLTKLPTSSLLHSPPSRKQSCIDLGSYNSNSKLPARLLKRNKSNQSLLSAAGAQRPSIDNQKLRQPSPQAKPLIKSTSNTSLKVLHKNKSSSQISGSSDDDSRSCLTRSSSNGSSSTTKSRRKRYSDNDQKKKTSVATQTTDLNEFDISLLKDELEREKSSARALLGQKEGK